MLFDILKTFLKTSGGHKTVPDNWVSGSSLHALLHHDFVLPWFKFHGEAHGFSPDPEDYSFLSVLSELGARFEAEWTNHVAPEAVRVLDHDHQCGEWQAFWKTLRAMQSDASILAKCALWNAEARVFGTADFLARSSWIAKKFPSLAHADELDHWVVLDCKYSQGLTTPERRTDLEAYRTQLRIYNHALTAITGYAAPRAYLICRDNPMMPLPVEMDQTLGAPLDPAIADLRDHYIDIKLNGAHYYPGRNWQVAPNWSHTQTEPWSKAKQQLKEELRPLETLPQIGRARAQDITTTLGFKRLDDILASDVDTLTLKAVKGIGKKIGDQIRAVLRANQSGAPSPVPSAALPPSANPAIYVDFEGLSSLRARWERFPDCSGQEMLFAIGCLYQSKNGTWTYRQMFANASNLAAERQILDEFLAFLHVRGVFDPKRKPTLYCWSHAEAAMAKRAALRHRLDKLDGLPWCDLSKVYINHNLAFTGTWDYSLKSVIRAIGECSPKYRVEYPKTGMDGLQAQVMAWSAYDQPRPLATDEMQTIMAYLKCDVLSTKSAHDYLVEAARKTRKASLNSARVPGWYTHALQSCTANQPTR